MNALSVINILFPFVMLIVSVVAVMIVYLDWSNTPPEDFARLNAQPQQVTPQAKPSQPTTPNPPPAESEDLSIGGVFSEVGSAFSDIRSDLKRSKEMQKASPLTEDEMFAALAEEIPEFRQAQQGGGAVSSTPPDDDNVEVLRVLRNRDNGTLFVEIQGKRYTGLSDFTDKKEGQRFLVHVRDLATFARLGRVNVPDMPLNELLPTQEKSAPPESSRPADDDDVIPWDMLSIPQQIDRILQARIQSSPTYANRNIRIMQAVDGGIQIVVDGQTYSGVDAIADPDDKAFVRAAIQEWEDQA